MKRILDIVRRGKAWKEFVQQTLLTHEERLSSLQASSDADRREVKQLQQEVTRLRREHDENARRKGFKERLQQQRFLRSMRSFDPALTEPDICVLLARRSDEVIVVGLPRVAAEAKRLGGNEPAEILSAICADEIGALRILTRKDDRMIAQPAPGLLSLMRSEPEAAYAWLAGRQPKPDAGAASPDFFERLDAVLAELDLIDFFANGEHGATTPKKPPFATPSRLPTYVPAQPKTRSVLFPHHCYYNFFYLAKALRKRGWDATTLSLDSPEAEVRNYSHGEDIRIYDSNPLIQQGLVADFFKDAATRFGVIHSYGIGILSLFSENYDASRRPTDIPWDLLEVKRRGTLLGYSHCGCMDSVSQGAFRAWSPTMCANCAWEQRPDVCSDRGNLAWGRKMTSIVDLFCTETDPPLDFKASSNSFRGPLTFAVDPEVWRADLNIPDRLRRERADGEIIVYHAMGNYELRSREGRNVKGTYAIVRAIEELRAEGISIRLDFVKDIPSIDNRFVQAQADIIVDQLHYGRYGALAREGMMLGKPVVGRVNKMDGPDLPATQCILDTPIVHADEQSIKNVLRDLALDPEKRREIGRKSREHVMRWWSADRLAARFEQVYDHIRDHGAPPAEADVP